MCQEGEEIEMKWKKISQLVQWNEWKENEDEEKMNSLSGIRTPVFHVTGEDT